MGETLTVEIKNIKRGYARARNNKLTVVVPQWAMNKSEEYGTYYICHELAHIMCWELFNTFAHSIEFKAIEDMYLADFGLSVQRKKAYPKTLIAFGQIVYQN